jgi:leader peptidase (prepilin peptidase)/N-methyltransferase
VAWLGAPGWLLLRGHCRACGAGLPSRLLYLPLLGAAAFALAAAATDGRRLALTLLFSTPLLALTATDFERHLLPNRIIYPTLAAAAALSWAWPGRSAPEMLAGGAAGFAVMFVLFIVLPGFGFGDVRLAGLLGLLAGLGVLLNALAVAAVAAGVAAVLMLVTRRVGRRGVIAYGPYLALGAYWAMLAG